MTRKRLAIGLILTVVLTLNGCAGKVSQAEKDISVTESNSKITTEAEMQTESVVEEEPADSSDGEETESKTEEVTVTATVTEPDTTKEVVTETPTPVVTESISKSETTTESEKKQTVTPTVTPTVAPTQAYDKNSEPTQAEPMQETVSYAGKDDCKAVADKLIEYINYYRSTPATKLPGLTVYAEYRSRQLVSNFAHDTDDERAAATALQYGKYVDTALYGMDGDPYYNANAREAIAKAGYVGSVDYVAEQLALLVKNSAGHWAYVGSSDYPYIAVGITYEAGMWHCDIAMARDNTYN